MGIVGESGSGKTVLSRTIMRLNLGSNVQTSGSVRFLDKELLDLPMAEMTKIWGQDMAMVFQDPMTSLNPVVKVGRQVSEHVRKHLGASKTESKDLAVELLRSVRIPEAETAVDRYPHELSGGMRQRISIAIALACGPKLLFADEPTTALDVTIQAQILELLERLQDELGMAVLMITHDLGVIAEVADRVAVMYAGKIVESAPVERIFSDPKHPYTIGLLDSIPKLNEEVDTLSVIPGTVPDATRFPEGCRFAPRCDRAESVCHDREPALLHAIEGVHDDESGHRVACWFAEGYPEAVEAPSI